MINRAEMQVDIDALECYGNSLASHVSRKLVTDLSNAIADKIVDGSAYVFQMGDEEYTTLPEFHSVRVRRSIYSQKIVCCEDCKYSDTNILAGKMWCKRLGEYTNSRGYCSWGTEAVTVWFTKDGDNDADV